MGRVMYNRYVPGIIHHNRRSIRLQEFDYSSPGAYLVTLMTNGSKCIFARIVNQEMHLNQVSKITRTCWGEIPNHFANVEVIPFIVMPNHDNGIITIIDKDRRGTIYHTPTTQRTPTTERAPATRAPTEERARATTERFGQPVPGSVPTIVRTYKAAVSRIARRELGCTNIWHRGYYEHVIRNQPEIEAIAAYILANPVRWSNDPTRITQ